MKGEIFWGDFGALVYIKLYVQNFVSSIYLRWFLNKEIVFQVFPDEECGFSGGPQVRFLLLKEYMKSDNFQTSIIGDVVSHFSFSFCGFCLSP